MPTHPARRHETRALLRAHLGAASRYRHATGTARCAIDCSGWPWKAARTHFGFPAPEPPGAPISLYRKAVGDHKPAAQ